MPLNLIQVQHYTATEAGAALLPFPVVMFALSRWSGGLVASIGSRLPLTVGPGSISVAITIGANQSHSVRSLLINGPAILIGVTLVAAAVFVAYRYADRLSRVIGETGMNVLLRLTAFILLCIGAQIVWNGASALLRTLAG